MILGQILRDEHLLALRDVEQQQLLAQLDLLQQHLDEDYAANESSREHGLEPVEDLPLFFRAELVLNFFALRLRHRSSAILSGPFSSPVTT